MTAQRTAAFSYSRLFKGGHHPPFEEAALQELGAAMCAGRSRISDQMPSGLVYFGQFIDHDITFDDTNLRDAGKQEPEATINGRNPLLDLDSLYGARGNEKAFLFDSKGRFLLGDAYENNKPKLKGYDLYRPRAPHDWTPEIVDERNAENIIILQLTVAFMHFHNRTLDKLDRGDHLPAVIPGTTHFEKARHWVTWHYQYFAVNEFLQAMLQTEVFDEVFAAHYSPRLSFNPSKGASVQLPVEFAVAAFRFGHSMVRDDYQLSKDVAKPLQDLIPHRAQPLTHDQVVEWPLFFDLNTPRANVAERIDTRIAKALCQLPMHAIGHFVRNAVAGTHVLPERTLVRGSRIGLPSGQEASEQAKTKFVDFEPQDPNYALLKKHGLLERTPLWYYLLHEAEITGTSDPNAAAKRLGGASLGSLGSRIVGEVFLGLLRADPFSYWNLDAKWSPPEVTSLLALTQLARQ